MAGASFADAQPLKGKQIRFVTMGSPGGGYDTYLRLLIPPMERHLGAKLIPLNETGAGGLTAMNRIVTAPADGPIIGLVGGEALVTSFLYKQPGVNYDLSTLEWIGRVSAESKVVLTGANGRFNTIGDMVASKDPVTFGGVSQADGNTDFSALAAYATGMKARMILGYKGTGPINMAMETGEVDGRVVSDESAILFTKGGQLKVVTVLARERSHQYPEIPTVFEAVKIGAEQARILDWRASVASLGRLVVTTPRSPADIVEAMRAALKSSIEDPEFKAELKKRQIETNYATGPEVERMLRAATTALDEETLGQVRKIVMERYY